MSSILNDRYVHPETRAAAPPRRLPGPRGLPVVGALPAMLRAGVFEYVERCWQEYGDMFEIPTVGRGRIVVVAHPDEIEHVLTHADIYVKDRNYDPVRPLLGQGLVTSSGDLWVTQRQLIQPTFHRKQLAGYAPIMVRCVQALLGRWEASRATGAPIDLYAEMMRFSHHMVGMTLFGLDLSDSAEESAHAVMESLQIAGQRVNRGAMNLPLGIPTPGNLRFRRAVATLDRLVYSIIDRARRAPADAADEPTLLRLLMSARGESGTGMTDRQLRDELVTQYVAGQETTALVLTWALHLLAGRADVVARVREESAGLDPAALTLEDCDRLAYTRMVVEEVMRIRPPVWALTRMARQDDHLRGHPIPAGTTVMFGIYFAHRHPDFWDAPEAFHPERFTPERVKARHRHAYLPFISGPRACVGRRFALYEAVICLVSILRRFDVEVLPGQRVGMKVGATCHPDRPVLARLRAP